jgi:hypothetical protein
MYIRNLIYSSLLKTNQTNYRTAKWASYFSGNAGQNYMNTLQWSVAAMNGALAGYGATPQGLIEPTVNIVSVNFISSLIGALTATAGKIIFNWIPRITKPLTDIGIMNPNPAPASFKIINGGQKMGTAGPSGQGSTGDFGYSTFLGIRTSGNYFHQTDAYDEGTGRIL